MNSSKTFNALAAPIGSFIGIACAAISGTAFFNFLAWHLAGMEISQEAAYSAVNNNPFFIPIGLVINISSNALAGIVAAKLEKNRPYLSALFAGLLIIIWSVVFLVTPVKSSHIDI